MKKKTLIGVTCLFLTMLLLAGCEMVVTEDEDLAREEAVRLATTLLPTAILPTPSPATLYVGESITITLENSGGADIYVYGDTYVSYSEAEKPSFGDEVSAAYIDDGNPETIAYTITGLKPGTTTVDFTIKADAYYLLYYYNYYNESKGDARLKKAAVGALVFSSPQNFLYTNGLASAILQGSLEVTVLNKQNSLFVSQPPSKTQYLAEEKLELEGMELELFNESGSKTTIPFADFDKNGITCSLKNGTVLNTEGETEITFTHTESGLSATGTVMVGVVELPTLLRPEFAVSHTVTGETSAEFNFSINEHCTVSMVIVPGGTATPSPENFAQLETSAVYSNIFTNCKSATVQVNALNQGTEYTAFFRPVNAGGIWPNELARVDFTTHYAQEETETKPVTPEPEPEQPEEEEAGTPITFVSASAVASTTTGAINADIMTDTDCSVYVLAVAAGQPAPTAAQLKASVFSASTTAHALLRIDLYGFSTGDYDVYAYAVNGKSESAITKLNMAPVSIP